MNTNTITKKQVAIVTGASSGMGLGITQALLEHGYRVAANSRNISKSKDLKLSSDLILVDGDISQMDSAIKVADAAIKHFDRIDLLVNAAGINIPKPTISIASSHKSSERSVVLANAGVAKYASYGEITEKDYDTIFNINVKGLLFTVQVTPIQLRPTLVRKRDTSSKTITTF
jgi:NAD(P)-dependent dehydrogenase (short-subunit alcohol dehydrogenase family)